MSDANLLITENMDIWTTAIKKRSSQGRGRNKKIELTGIKRLRELILELAVRGQLVPQDPNDEPASVLLEKIAAEKEQLIKDKKIKKAKPQPEISVEKMPLKLPNNWLITRLDDIGITFIGLTYSPKDISDKGIPVLRSSNVQKGKIDLNDLVRVNKDVKESLLVDNGDLLICARNGSKALVGKTAMIKDLQEPMAFGAFMAIFKCSINSYVEVFLNSPVFRRMLEGVATTTINQITQSNLKSTIIFLPPLAEQHRIVAKVDELMALCDQLEQQTENSITAHQTLVETLLATLNNSENPAAFKKNWTRVAEHFDTLFTTEHSIDQLKQTILQLAVMGKLIPQNPNDEPASVLLKKIAAEKEQLIKDKVIKKQKPLPAISEGEKPFELPSGWQWMRLGYSFNSIISGGTPSKSNPLFWDGDIPWASVKDLGVKKYITSTQDYITKEGLDNGSKLADKGDILICTRMGLGKITIANIPIAFNQDLKAVKLTSKLDVEFFLNSFSTLKIKGTGTTVAGIKQEELLSYVIGLPPQAEQQRIVKKVDELMTLCDQLKSRLSQAQTIQLHLADTLVKQSVN